MPDHPLADRTILARFFVQAVELQPSTMGGKVRLAAAYRGERNKDWAAATPTGSMELYVNNPGALEFFEDMVRASRTGALKFPELDLSMKLAPQD